MARPNRPTKATADLLDTARVYFVARTAKGDVPGVEKLAVKSDRQLMVSAAGGWWAGSASGPAVAVAGLVNEPADHGERGREAEPDPELDDDLALVGAAAQLAVAVEPCVGPLDRLPAAGLDEYRLPLRRDAGLEAEELLGRV
jgi:hypothetical protein